MSIPTSLYFSALNYKRSCQLIYVIIQFLLFYVNLGIIDCRISWIGQWP